MFEEYKEKRVLITGGIGFIGSNLARRLVQIGADVTLVDSLIPEYGGNLFNIQDIRDAVHVNISDVRDMHSMKYLIQGKEYLFNLAGQTSHMDSMSDPFTDLEINCKSQLSILEICRSYNPDIKITYASTRQIYGKPDYLPIDEKHPVRPVDVNGINKMAGEWYHILYNNVYGIRSCALRLTNTYGPGMRVKDARQTFLGVWVKNLISGLPIDVWGGEQLRDFNYVDDVVDVLLLCGLAENASGKVYNLGGKPVVSLKDLAEMSVQANGGGSYNIIPFPPERKKIDIGDYYADYSFAVDELNWQPAVDLETGLRKTFEYFKVHLQNYL
ncbi:MAG: NAD-dependent epimerase/dehydratase family protein [Ignavibacteria bacterium]|nr:NAD-dependent epimerase/dehydratase family protein [Ignavibacteria bacterium]